MKKLCLLAIFLCAAGVKAQIGVPAGGSVTCDNPTGCVLLTREAAQKAIEEGDARKAAETQVKQLKLDIEGDPTATPNADGTPSPKNLGYRGVNHKLEVEFARVSGEYSGFKQGSVRVDVAFDTAIKNTRKKCAVLGICF